MLEEGPQEINLLNTDEHVVLQIQRLHAKKQENEHARQHAASFARLYISNTFSRVTKSVFGQRALLIWGDRDMAGGCSA